MSGWERREIFSPPRLASNFSTSRERALHIYFLVSTGLNTGIKIGIFCVGCLRRPSLKIDSIFSVGRLKQPAPKIPIFCLSFKMDDTKNKSLFYFWCRLELLIINIKNIGVIINHFSSNAYFIWQLAACVGHRRKTT
jgi:hypothetical protein